jgi:hypothetical protein
LGRDNKIQYFADGTAVLVSKHKKEEAIAPVLQQLNWQIKVYPLDTDQFGTFTGEIPRQGTPLEAARRKIAAAQRQTEGTIWLASEGSFGPHPDYSFLPMNHELILCYDSVNDLEIVAEAMETDTNYNRQEISSWQDLAEFARIAGFPEHGIIIKGEKENKPIKILKEINNFKVLEQTYHQLQGYAIVAETDMRALYNPKRMRVIAKAAQQLTEKIQSLCPSCQTPGFWISENKPGLPCEWCGKPTKLVKMQVKQCKKCGYRQETSRMDGKQFADPMYCDFCNP